MIQGPASLAIGTRFGCTRSFIDLNAFADHYLSHLLTAQHRHFLPGEIDDAIPADVKGFQVDFAEYFPAVFVRIFFCRAFLVLGAIHNNPARQISIGGHNGLR